MPTPSTTATYVSLPERVRPAPGGYKRAIDAEHAARGTDDVLNPGGLATPGEIKQSPQEP
jgi:hypothetical protein